MAFTRFRPTSHFIAPHSWSNDPCGAVFVPETKEYLFCYQWNPGTTDGGNCAWGMAKSKDLVSWTDCTPPITNGAAGTYDHEGVFSGSIVSRLIDGKTALFLFYTSVSRVPIHWSKEYLEGCESQSVAFSMDFGTSWHRYENNPLISVPPKKELSTGWRDPFVSPWTTLSNFLGVDLATDYMMIASGERGRGPALHLYSSNNLLDWEFCSTILEVERNTPVSPASRLLWGMNFECASFFNIGESNYVLVGIEEDLPSKRHNRHYTLWLRGNFVLEEGKAKFQILNHGMLDFGILYAIHVFRDAEGRLLQLGWADESANEKTVSQQGWAGCIAHPRELYEISIPIIEGVSDDDIWCVNQKAGTMETLGVRPAPQIAQLHDSCKNISLNSFDTIRSTNFEIRTTFIQPAGTEKFTFNVRQSPSNEEVTKVEFNLKDSNITVDRNKTSLDHLGSSFPETGEFNLLSGEDLRIRIFVDNSIIEVYANDRFALTSRIYPSLESLGASYDFGGFEESRVEFQCWEGLDDAWPARKGVPVTNLTEVVGEKTLVEVIERPTIAV
jgi:beta-fructofuranosidase